VPCPRDHSSNRSTSDAGDKISSCKLVTAVALSPAFDVAYSYNPSGAWTRQHQMSLNGKRDKFGKEDLFAFANNAGLKKRKATSLLREVAESVANWPHHAKAAGVATRDMERIKKSFRLHLTL